MFGFGQRAGAPWDKVMRLTFCVDGDGTGSRRCTVLAHSSSSRNSAGVKPACRRIDAKVPRFTTPYNGMTATRPSPFRYTA